MRHIVQSLCCLEEDGDSESSKDIKPHSDWVYLCMQLFKEVVLIVISSLTGSSYAKEETYRPTP